MPERKLRKVVALDKLIRYCIEPWVRMVSGFRHRLSGVKLELHPVDLTQRDSSSLKSIWRRLGTLRKHAYLPPDWAYGNYVLRIWARSKTFNSISIVAIMQIRRDEGAILYCACKWRDTYVHVCDTATIICTGKETK